MLIIIIGEPGAGKTALMSYFQSEKMINGIIDYLNSKKEIDKLNAGGFSFEYPIQKHLCYSDYDFKMSSWCSSYVTDGYKIGLDNVFFETQLFPPYSNIFLDEAHKYYDSRATLYIRPSVYRWYQIHRHNHYNIWMTVQRLENIDINIRQLADKYIVIDEMKVIEGEYGCVEKINWKCHEFSSLANAEKYSQEKESGVESIKFGRKTEYSTDLDIFSFYNSYGCKAAFYENRFSTKVLKFEYFSSQGYEFSINGFKEYNDTHLFSAPEGFLKNKERDKKILEKYHLNEEEGDFESWKTR